MKNILILLSLFSTSVLSAVTVFEFKKCHVAGLYADGHFVNKPSGVNVVICDKAANNTTKCSFFDSTIEKAVSGEAKPHDIRSMFTGSHDGVTLFLDKDKATKILFYKGSSHALSKSIVDMPKKGLMGVKLCSGIGVEL